MNDLRTDTHVNYTEDETRTNLEKTKKGDGRILDGVGHEGLVEVDTDPEIVTHNDRILKVTVVPTHRWCRRPES